MRIVRERQVAKSITFNVEDVIFKVHPNECNVGAAVLCLPNSIVKFVRKQLIIHIG